MQVETFECSETAAEPIEASEEAIGIIQSLGLQGQQELIVGKDTRNPTRLPYREMTKDEVFVYGVLCPQAVKLNEYRVAPIPLRVLQVAAHAKETGMFHCFQVWDRESAAVVDPVLVGLSGEPYAWNVKRFILARWGEVLEPFVVLSKRAATIWRERAISSVESIARRINAVKSQVEGLTFAEMMEKGAGFVPKLEV